MRHENLILNQFKKSQVETLEIESKALKGNPWKDPYKRLNPVLLPKKKSKDLPVVFVLAGFTGNGPKYFGPKSFEKNAIETLAGAIEDGIAPQALYVFVDAMTKWGGSQFVNSTAMGDYQTYVGKELPKQIKKEFPVSADPKFWCVCGGSSGGYGALSLASQFPETFGRVAAIAPDSYFDFSLLPELLSAKPTVDKLGGVLPVLEELENGRLMRRRDSHTILNAVAMGLCYSPKGRKNFNWPIDDNGKVIKKVWKQWVAKDPIHFLVARKRNLSKLKSIYLDVGKKDQYQLQYGTRQIAEVLRQMKVSLKYSEFDGTHFDIGERRIHLWKWLNQIWRK